MFRFLILGLFRKGRVHHGYALMKAYRELCGVQISTGSFYRELQRLVSEGWITPTDDPGGADPRRACYTITAAGAIAFDVWLAERVDVGDAYVEDDFSARALFIGNAGPGVVGSMLDRWREELWFHGKLLERARERIAGSTRRREDLLPIDVFVARRLKHIAADLQFVDEFSAAYENWSGNPGKGSGGTAAAAGQGVGRRRPGGGTTIRRPK
jgi:DNA-binding PadR family transcriptional regulator